MPYYEKTLLIGKRVNELREKFNENNVDLCRLIGVSESHKSKLLKDSCSWSEDLIETAAAHYGVTVSYLINGDNDTAQSFHADILSDIVIRCKDLPEEERNRAFHEAMLKMNLIMLGKFQ